MKTSAFFSATLALLDYCSARMALVRELKYVIFGTWCECITSSSDSAAA
jgi:hypothetical protein